MKISNYMCNSCSVIHTFQELDRREKYLCPDCGCEMWYVNSEDVDDETGLVIERYADETREANSPKNDTNIMTVTCPYCHSTDTKRISGFSKAVEVGLLGILAMDRMGKQWHCNHCNSDF